MKEIYTLSNVSKKYNSLTSETIALDNINLEVKEHEFIVILGPSGSGKSTLLNILSGIDNPTKGKIRFYNQDITKFNENELSKYRKDNIGFVFQSYNLISNLTVKENIELGRELSSEPLNVDDIIKIVELEKHINKFPYQLSGGQMQRVSIARALVKNPKVLFCDEPTGALDEKTGKKVLTMLQNINKEYRTTLIIVTHNPSIKNMANTVINMNSGKIIKITHNIKTISGSDVKWV
ncbi:MAG: ABC transporter ATP-binding protein [Tenericutes bacterium]|jgi:putative ABC transport system ATP-binding protein|nr:ABC transporter ATP-binding protein [Mycoplasmatota bacterium]